MRKPFLSLTLIALVATSLWYLQAPPRTADAYGDVASKTAESIAAQVETARLWARAVRQDSVLSTSASVGLEDAERRAERAVAKFAALDPPADAESVRTRFTHVADPATAALVDLRIAAHNGDWRAVERADARLARIARGLRHFAGVAER